MNLQPIYPTSALGGEGGFNVVCSVCSSLVGSEVVLCDLDAKWGTYYCPACRDAVEATQHKGV